MEYEDRRFRLIWQTVDWHRRAKVGVLAVLGRRSPDPKTAWLVCMFALGQLRWQWLRFFAGVVFLAMAIWGFALIHTFRFLPVLQFAVGVMLLASLSTYRRAVRVNEPMAEAPGK